MKIINILFITMAFLNTYANSFFPTKLYDKNDKIINVKVWFKVGSQNDPEGKEGICYLTSKTMANGNTLNFKYSEILKKLYPYAAGYDVNVSTEMTVFNFSVHKDNFNKVINLFTDAIVNPAFDEKDIERIKSNMLTYLESTLLYNNDEELGKAVLYNEIFKNTPYAHITQGFPKSINNITKQDIVNFYKQYFNKNNYQVFISGDFDEKMYNKIYDLLKKLPDGNKSQYPQIVYEPIVGNNALIIEKDANATAISVGVNIPIVRGMRDWYALAIANSYFGEHRNSISHLYQVIREARGLNYGDYSYIEHFPNGGSLNMPPQNVCKRYQLFEIWIRPVPNNTHLFVIKALKYELDKLYKNGLTVEQFEKQKKFLKNYINFYAQTNYERLGYKIDDIFYGIKEGHLNLYQKMLDEITYDEVQNAIKKYLNPENLLFVIITKDGETLKKELLSNQFAKITYTSPKPDYILREDEVIGNYNLNFKNIEIRQIQNVYNNK